MARNHGKQASKLDKKEQPDKSWGKNSKFLRIFGSIHHALLL